MLLCRKLSIKYSKQYRSTKMNKPGYQKSAVMKAGIIVCPVPVPVTGGISTRFRIRVTKASKTGAPIEIKGANLIYGAKPTMEKIKDAEGNVETIKQVSVWKKIQEIEQYYYNKLQKK